MTYPRTLAIPGSPCGQAASLPGTREIEDAIERVAALNRLWMSRSFFGPAGPDKIIARDWSMVAGEPCLAIDVTAPEALRRGSAHIMINMCWRILVSSADWYTPGWWDATRLVEALIPEARRELDQALNPQIKEEWS